MPTVWVFVQIVNGKPHVTAFTSYEAAREAAYEYARINWPYLPETFPADVDEALNVLHHARRDITFSLMEALVAA